MEMRSIPGTEEPLPVVGVGTYRKFDVAPTSPAYAALPAVLDALFAAGGSVLDSSPMYGRAEETAGELLDARNLRPKAFLATKVWTTGRTAGIRQMEESFRLLKTERIDLMQVHNLVDWQVHLATMRRWQEEGRIRYVGITHYTPSAYDAVEAVMRAARVDFLQINYALDEREAEARLLPMARDLGIAVIANRPLGGGGLMRRLARRPLPGWAAGIGAASWAQLALKFALSHPAVTCVIPGTGQPENMRENAAAGSGPMLTEGQRRELVEAVG